MRHERAPVDLSNGDEVVAWVERHCCHSKSEWAGQPLILAPWQRDLVRELFGRLRPDGRRQYRTALIGVPRKAGKSTMGAAMALRLLFRDGEPGAEVYSAAADRDQARIVFEIARGMVEASPAMSKIAKVYRNSIVVPRTGSTYRVLSAEAYSKHGLSPSAVLVDELHAQPNRELWDVLTTGQGARRQPLTVAITTAGYDRESICFELYHYGRQIEAGVLEDPTFFFRWWGAAEDDPWDDEATWHKAQPNLGISVSLEFMRAEARQARQQPARENTFRRLYLNQWTQQATRWLSLAAWDASAGMVVESKLQGRACYGGLDLASTQDLTAFALDFPGDDGGHQVLWRFWLPEERLQDLDRRTAGQASVWVRQGRLSLTPGNVVDHQAILEQVDRDARAFNLREIAFDRWGMTQIAQTLQDNGLTVIPFGQGFSSMSGPTREFERLVLDRKYAQDRDPAVQQAIGRPGGP
jgi:phage terminase large subunit-like protein